MLPKSMDKVGVMISMEEWISTVNSATAKLIIISNATKRVSNPKISMIPQMICAETEIGAITLGDGILKIER